MISEEDYLVYSAVYDWKLDPIIFKDKIKRAEERRKKYKTNYQGKIAGYIENKTLKDPGYIKFEKLEKYTLEQRFPDIDQTIIKDYILKNKKSVTLEDKLKSKYLYKIITPEEVKKIRSLDPDKFWENFRKKYSEGSISQFSRVGYNSDKNKTLVQYSWNSDWLSGSGNYLYLEKKNNQWFIQKINNIWIS